MYVADSYIPTRHWYIDSHMVQKFEKPGYIHYQRRTLKLWQQNKCVNQKLYADKLNATPNDCTGQETPYQLAFSSIQGVAGQAQDPFISASEMNKRDRIN